MLKFFKHLRNDEAGAVTVDWVVLTAALVGIGIAVISAVQVGINSKTSEIVTELSGQ